MMLQEYTSHGHLMHTLQKLPSPSYHRPISKEKIRMILATVRSGNPNLRFPSKLNGTTTTIIPSKEVRGACKSRRNTAVAITGLLS
jgi:hypothetical protein